MKTLKQMTVKETKTELDFMYKNHKGTKGNILCECGGTMIVRESNKDNNKFYGCSNYPKCTIKIGRSNRNQEQRHFDKLASMVFGSVRTYGSGGIDDYVDHDFQEDWNKYAGSPWMP